MSFKKQGLALLLVAATMFGGSFALSQAQNAAGDVRSVSAAAPASVSLATPVVPKTTTSFANPKVSLNGTGHYRLPEFVEVIAKLDAMPKYGVSASYEWRIYEQVVDCVNLSVREVDYRVKVSGDRVSFYAVVPNKTYQIDCIVTVLYAVRDGEKVTELATSTTRVHGAVNVTDLIPGPSPEPGPTPIPVPQPVVTKQKLIIAIVSDMKNQNPALVNILRNPSLTDRLAKAGHELRLFDRQSPDIAKNGVSKAITDHGIVVPAIVFMKADGDRGAVVSVVTCPMVEADLVAAITKAGGAF